MAPKKFSYAETAESKREHDHEAWDPEWVRYTFTTQAECDHPNCKQVFSIVGNGSVETIMTDEGWEWEERFKPTFCNPMPDMIAIPAKCPIEIQATLTEAFSLFWLNTAACAGRVRVALEFLMDHLSVPKKKKTKQGKYTSLSLHARIKEFADKEPVTGNQLMALKWLGNTGSHDKDLSEEDLLDALEILEHVLGELIDKKSAKVAALAKKLIKKHGKK